MRQGARHPVYLPLPADDTALLARLVRLHGQDRTARMCGASWTTVERAMSPVGVRRHVSDRLQVRLAFLREWSGRR